MSTPTLERIEPGTEPWLRLMTASKVAAILGVSTYDSPRSMWHKMRGDLPREEANDVQKRGNYLEDGILNWWFDQHGITPSERKLQPTYFLSDWAAATPDAVACHPVDDTVLVEAKSARDLDEWGDPGTDQIPATYLIQCYWQMHVSGIHRCYIPILGTFLDFAEYVVDYDPQIGAALEARCREFMDSLRDDEPPAIDDTKPTYEALRKVYRSIDGSEVDLDEGLAVRYLDAINLRKDFEADERLAKSQVLEAMGTSRYGVVNGVRVCRRQANKSGYQLNQVAKTSADLTPIGETNE